MRLVKAGQVIQDHFVRLLDEAAVPDESPVLVPAARLLADGADFAARHAPTGVLWPNDRPVAQLAPLLDRLAMVALVFPNFRDGRAYSQARLLRERHGFAGELRATGQVLQDQFVSLARVGFDAFEVKKDADAQAFVTAMSRYSAFYQPVGKAETVIRWRRSGRAAAAVSPVSSEAVR
jgi:uncharacterized protein (DUF934 family)